jgi:hypothetical protein
VIAAAVLLALLAAACFALDAALQQRAAKQVPPHRTLDVRLLLRLLRHPLWLIGWLPGTAGTVLQAIALHFGPLALVQPVLVSSLLMAIPLEAALDRRWPHRRDLLTGAVSALGLAAFLAAAAPRDGIGNPSPAGWLGIGAGSAAAIALCLATAGPGRTTRRGVLLGIATGILYALTAALLKATIAGLDGHPAALLTDWRPYALVLVGLAGLLLNQNAFQDGPLAAPLTALAVVDPLASLLIGATAFHERLSVTGPRLAVELVATLAMARGIWLASRTRAR